MKIRLIKFGLNIFGNSRYADLTAWLITQHSISRVTTFLFLIALKNKQKKSCHLRN